MGRGESFLLGFLIGVTVTILLIFRVGCYEKIDSNEYKYSYCPYCGEELEYKFEDTE